MLARDRCLRVDIFGSLKTLTGHRTTTVQNGSKPCLPSVYSCHLWLYKSRSLTGRCAVLCSILWRCHYGVMPVWHAHVQPVKGLQVSL